MKLAIWLAMFLLSACGGGGSSAPSPQPQAAAELAPASDCSSGKSVKIRRLIARKMEEAWRTIPHFYVTMPIDMTDVIRFRKDLGATINDLSPPILRIIRVIILLGTAVGEIWMAITGLLAVLMML